jgi:UDP-glucuronate 4-epimerase
MSNHAILVTGTAGFIGFHAGRELMAAGRDVVGLDSINDYYDPELKRARLALLGDNPRFNFIKRISPIARRLQRCSRSSGSPR